MSTCNSNRQGPYVIKCSASLCTTHVYGSSCVAVRGLRVIGANERPLPCHSNLGVRYVSCNMSRGVIIGGIAMQSIGNSLMGRGNKKYNVCVIGNNRGGVSAFGELAVRGYRVLEYAHGTVV